MSSHNHKREEAREREAEPREREAELREREEEEGMEERYNRVVSIIMNPNLNSAVDLTQNGISHNLGRTPSNRRSTRQDNRQDNRVSQDKTTNPDEPQPPPRPGKRGTRTATLQEKIAAIKRVRDGESKASVARDIGIPESTLRGWCKMEHKLLNQINNMKANGSFDRISSTSESERDSSRSSLSQSPANLPGPSTAGKEVKTEENNAFTPPPTKKCKIENDAASTSNAVPSMALDPSFFFSPNHAHAYLFNLMQATSNIRNMYDLNKILLSNPLNNFSSYLNNTNSLATTSMIGNTSTMSNTINNTPREINGKRSRGGHRIPSSTNTSMTNSVKTQSPNVTAVEKEAPHLVSKPSTSTSTSTSTPTSSLRINGTNHMAGPTSTKLSQHRKNHINDIAQSLLIQQQQKKQLREQQRQVQQQSIQQQPVPQQQPENSYSCLNSENNLNGNLNLIQNSDIMREWLRQFPVNPDLLNGQSVQTNTLNNNNNSIQNNNAIANSSATVIHAPADIQEAIYHGTRFLTWLKEHHNTLYNIAYRQVETVQKLVESIIDWNRRSILSKHNSIS